MFGPFFTETVTAWISLASVVGSVSTIALTCVNFACLRSAKQQADSATEQATVALYAATLARERIDAAKETLAAMLSKIDAAQQVSSRETPISIDAPKPLARTERAIAPPAAPSPGSTRACFKPRPKPRKKPARQRASLRSKPSKTRS